MRKLFLVLFIFVFFLSGCETFFSDTPESPEKPSYSPNEILQQISPEERSKDEEHVLVKFVPNSDVKILLEEWETEVVKEWEQLGWTKIAVPKDFSSSNFLQEINNNSDVLKAEPNLAYELEGEVIHEENDYKDRLWGLENINAPEAWDITTGSEDVIVAIIDTGVDLSHPEWEGHEIVNPYNATDDFYPATIDLSGHGTHVAGIAVNDGETGKTSGVTWNSPLLPVRVLNYMTDQILVDYLIEAITFLGDFAAQNDQKRIVANMSIGGRGYSAALKDAIDYALENGVTLVTSAGNEHKQVIMFPAAYNGVISVAAVDGNNEKASFSSTGFWNNVAAPGKKIWSAVPSLPGSSMQYTYMQGTSMASPYVAGAVALLLSENPELTPLEIKNQIEQTAQGEGFSPDLGHGILDVEKMLDSKKPQKYGGLRVESDLKYGLITLFDKNGDLISFGSTGEEKKYIFHALSPGPYTVYLSHEGEVMEGVAQVEQGEKVTLEF